MVMEGWTLYLIAISLGFLVKPGMGLGFLLSFCFLFIWPYIERLLKFKKHSDSEFGFVAPVIFITIPMALLLPPACALVLGLSMGKAGIAFISGLLIHARFLWETFISVR
jgi:hypothetical protein